MSLSGSTHDTREYGDLASTASGKIATAPGTYLQGDEAVPQSNDDEIVVTGKRIPSNNLDMVWLNLISISDVDLSGFDGMTSRDDGSPGVWSEADNAAIDVIIDIDRPLTDAEKKAIETLLKTIEEVTRAIDGLSDTATYRLPGGELVTGKELKEIWATTDFHLTNGDIETANADFTRGPRNLQINIDIEWLEEKNRIEGGVLFTVLHEFGHGVDVSRAAIHAAYADGMATEAEVSMFQRLANDVARFIASHAGLIIQTEVGYDYTDGSYTVEEPVVPRRPTEPEPIVTPDR